MRKKIIAASLGLFLFSVVNANATVYLASGTVSPNNVDVSAKATITFDAMTDILTVVLENLKTGITSEGQALSGISFDFSGVTGSSGFTQAGSLVDVATGGAETSVSGSPTHWTGGSSGAAISIDTVPGTGGKPADEVIPTVLGGANNGFQQHDPYIAGPGTFTLHLTGASDMSVISNVAFQFGTTAGSNLLPGRNPLPVGSVPEPSTWAMMLLGFFGVGFLAYRRNGRSGKLAFRAF